MPFHALPLHLPFLVPQRPHLRCMSRVIASKRGVVCAGMASKDGHWVSNKAFDKSMLFEAWRLAGGWLAAGWPGHQTESTFLDSRVTINRLHADGDYDFTP